MDSTSVKDDVNLFIENFKYVKNLGFVKSRRSHNTGVGKTLEDLMNIEENNLSQPDFRSIEIKSQRKLTESYITLFTKAPSFPLKANTLLRDEYGEIEDDNLQLKKLKASMFCSRFSNVYGKWGFRLLTDDSEQKLFIKIKNLSSNELEETLIYYDYSELKALILKKLNIIAYVTAEEKTINGDKCFHYTDFTIYFRPDSSDESHFDNFLSLIKNSTIMYDIRIGSYKSGRNFGKPHDHGSAFRIRKQNIKDLLPNIYDFE